MKFSFKLHIQIKTLKMKTCLIRQMLGTFSIKITWKNFIKKIKEIQNNFYFKASAT